MKKNLLIFSFLFVCLLFLTGCLPKKQLAAIQINSYPTASIFIDGRLVGKTPYVNKEMKPGEINLKLIPESTASALNSWENKLKLEGGVMTVVTREFAEQEEFSSGDVLTLEAIRDKKIASLAVVSSPDGVLVKLNGENKGPTPLVLDKIEEGEYEINLLQDGYVPRTLRARVVKGFKLIINSKLAKVGGMEISPTPTGTFPTGKITPKPTSLPSISPTLRPTVSISGESIEIKETETGWLRVRSGPGRSYQEITRVYPGEKYPLLEEKEGWYKIEYEKGKEGWISSQYAKKLP